MNKNLDSEAYYEQGQRAHDSKRYNHSIINCKRAITTKSNHYLAHFLWGRNLVEKRASDTAIRKHREIISRNPMDSSPYHNLGIIFDRQERLSEAEIHYKKCIEIDSTIAEPCYNLAIVLTKLAKYTEALEQYEKNIRNHPHDSSTHNCHGYLKFTLGKYEDALESFEDAIRKDVEYSLPYLNKSLVLYCLGKLELAVEIFKQSLGKVASDEDWETRLKKNLRIYEGEVSRFQKILEGDDLGEIYQENLVLNIKALAFVVDLLRKEVKG